MSDCKHEAALREASGLLVFDDPHNPIAYDWARVLDAAADHIAAQRAAIDRLTRERDEARAEVRALCGEIGALDPYLPDGWTKRDGYALWHRVDVGALVQPGPWGADWREIAPTKPTSDVLSGTARSPLAAMRAADEALATEAAQ